MVSRRSKKQGVPFSKFFGGVSRVNDAPHFSQEFGGIFRQGVPFSKFSGGVSRVNDAPHFLRNLGGFLDRGDLFQNFLEGCPMSIMPPTLSEICGAGLGRV